MAGDGRRVFVLVMFSLGADLELSLLCVPRWIRRIEVRGMEVAEWGAAGMKLWQRRFKQF